MREDSTLLSCKVLGQSHRWEAALKAMQTSVEADMKQCESSTDSLTFFGLCLQINTLTLWKETSLPNTISFNTVMSGQTWQEARNAGMRRIPDLQAWLYHGKSLTPLRSYLHLIELLPHWVIQRLPASKISNQSTLKCDSFTILHYPILYRPIPLVSVQYFGNGVLTVVCMELTGIRATQGLATFAAASQSLGCKSVEPDLSLQVMLLPYIDVFDIKTHFDRTISLLDCDFHSQMLTIPAHQVLQPMVLHWHPRRIPVHLDENVIHSPEQRFQECTWNNGLQLVDQLQQAWVEHDILKVSQVAAHTGCHRSCLVLHLANVITTKLPFLDFHLRMASISTWSFVHRWWHWPHGSRLSFGNWEVWWRYDGQIWSKQWEKKSWWTRHWSWSVDLNVRSFRPRATKDAFCWSRMVFAWACIKSKIEWALKRHAFVQTIPASRPFPYA